MISPLRPLALYVLFAAPAVSQTAVQRTDSTLSAITARGRLLLAYDIAAWHGGDALQALKPAPGDVNASFARRMPSGRWEVIYGRLTSTKDTFYITYRATQTDADSQFTAAKLPAPLADVGVQREMALAFETAQHDFGKITRPYNSYVLPAEGGGFWVYLLPAQTDPRVFPLGGDVRYQITGGTTIAEKVRLHNAILDRQAVPANAVAMMHTSFDSLPSETDVFVVLRRFPKIPEVVATKKVNYEIGIDGSISTLPATSPLSQAIAQPHVATAPATTAAAAAAPAGHIPVWHVKIDTVGSAARIMSPGYTEWRDTSTGWRMTLERTVEIKGADSGSYDGSWRTLMLPDGRVLVSRQRPASLQLYDTEGRYVREIGHAGTGPEEYQSAPTLAMKGDTLLAFDGIQSRMMLFMLDGRFIRSFQVHTRGSPIPIEIDHRGYVRVQQRYGFPNDSLSRMQWVYYTMRGTAVDSIMRPPLLAAKIWRVLDGTRSMSFMVPLAPSDASAFLPDGTLIYGVGSRFELFATRTGRDTVRIFGRSDVAPVKVEEAFGDTTFAQLTRFQPLLATVAKRSDIPKAYPLWNSIAVDDKGYLWVSQGVRGRTPVSYSIFAPDGRYLGYVQSWFDRLDAASWSGEHVAYVGYDNDHRAVLRIYRIDRRGM
jgi:hypothetical protein